MREIKFRAWNKNKKIMCYENEDNTATYLDGWFASDVQVINQTLNSKYSNYVFMQNTGLKDKNGVEIYEGDIIEYKDSTGLHRETVIFDKGCFYAGLHGGSSTRVSPKLINTRIAKVIGNIYEVKDETNCNN